MFNTYKVVMYHIAFAMMMVPDRAESIKEPINNGRFINQFPLDTIKSTRKD